MSFVAEFVVSSPILRETRKVVPEMTFETEDVRRMPDSSQKFVFWASGDDFDAFESGVEDDPTVADYCLLADLGDRRLYRVTLSESVAERMTHSVAVERDITFLDVTADTTESRVRARVPNRDALCAYRDACREMGFPFRLVGIYDESETNADGQQYGVTTPQREALVCALAAGYFDVPRRTTLTELAEDLGISDQALSARLRRGQASLVENALDGDAAT
ncbi:helix-turn-helix domain-containing protein [Halorussus caseinilyticus]|uniref:Helix-turn-helix domain-containing protein n=1 Tax=Halorussus caseinilyticus TaxID=3034025 RepID=A0ABD5WL12_9EURY|nr:helix-turn-helix domain-containing protein [Halorussus sp. DT72]